MQGQRVGSFRIDRTLGSGGMGAVYAATAVEGGGGVEAGTVVALKVVHPHLIDTPGFRERFLREGEIGQTIRHENVVRTYHCNAGPGGGAGDGGGAAPCFLVMEYVEGQTLAALQRELERVPEELCRHVAREICKGLAAIHAAGVVHRDIKPENVLITPDHVVKIMDLGIARLADDQLGLSATGAFVGSVEYAAPEQFKGGGVDGRTDLHALGLLLYELATGTHPYRGGAFHEVLRRVCEDEPRRAGALNPQLSPFFEELVHTLLVKDPRGRFASAELVLDVLARSEESTWWGQRARHLQAETRRPLRRVRIPRETAVYGRDAELGALRDAYRRARSGEGAVVLVEGEAGIGKSRLVDELVARLEAEGEELQFLFGSYPPGGAATASGGLAAAFREHFGADGSAPHLEGTPLLVPAFDAALRGEPAPDGSMSLTRDALGTCYVHATRSLAAARTTIVLVDDLHFAPEEARAIFTALALAVPGHRVLLVGTMRPGVPEDWIAHVTRLGHATRMGLQRLGPKDLAALLRDTFKSQQLAEQLAFKIATKSDGNPFFAFEIIRGLREGNFITRSADGTWATTRVIDEIEVPSSVLDLVNARVSALSEDERNLLDVAACLGYEFDPLLVGEVLGLARIPLLRQLGQIERAHRLVRAAGRRYVFDHHQVQEALYGSLSELLREEYHAALAETLEARTGAADKSPDELDGALAVELCSHFLSGARAEQAVRYIHAAQAHLLAGHLGAQMVPMAEAVLAEPGLLDGEERAKVLLALARALDALGRRDRQEECAREVLEIADRLGLEKTHHAATMELAGTLFRVARYGEAEEIINAGIERARKAGDDAIAAIYVGRLGTVHFDRGQMQEAEALFRRAVEGNTHPGHCATNTMNLGNALAALGRYDESREAFERALQLHHDAGHRLGEASVLSNLGILHTVEARHTEARKCAEQALAIARDSGQRQLEAMSLNALSAALLGEGRPDEAVQHGRETIRLCREIGFRRGEVIASTTVGSALTKLGRLEEARTHLEHARDVSDEIGYRPGVLKAVDHLATVAWVAGDLERAEDLFVRCIELASDLDDRFIVVHTRRVLGHLLMSLGRDDEARASIETSLAQAREIGRAADETLACCLLATFPGGDAAEAEAVLDRNRDELRPEEIREAHMLLYKATDDRGHLETAKRLLDEALAALTPAMREVKVRVAGVDRAIDEAWAEAGGDGPSGATESRTRVG